MRIACLQFAPQVGQVSNNISRADKVLSEADPSDLENLDLLVLPEMSFSGYNFKSLQEIMPYLEPSASGISADWARTMASKYSCTVGVGYPEVEQQKVEGQGQGQGQEEKAAPKNYNSLVFIGKDGEVLANYRKSFLYYTDETWALEGSGFYQGKMGNFGKVAMGICMDINPYKFEAPYEACEFACHVQRVRANLVIVSMAWLTFADREAFTAVPERPDIDTLNYWIHRLSPIIEDSSNTEEVIVVFANRCGIEDEVLYAGTSTVVGIKDGEVKVYGVLGRGEEKLLVVDTEDSPFTRLVIKPIYQDEEDGASDLPSDEFSGEEEEEEDKDDDQKRRRDRESAESPPPPSNHNNNNKNPDSKPTESNEPTLPTNYTSAAQLPTKFRPKLSIRTDTKSLSPPSFRHPQIHIAISPASTPDDTPYTGLDQNNKDNYIVSALPVSSLYTPDEPTWPLESGDISPWSFESGSPVFGSGSPVFGSRSPLPTATDIVEKDYFSEWLVSPRLSPSPEGMFRRGSQIWRVRDGESTTLGGLEGECESEGYRSWKNDYEDGGISPRTVVGRPGTGYTMDWRREKTEAEIDSETEEDEEVEEGEIRIGASPSIWKDLMDENEDVEEYMVKGGILSSPQVWSSSPVVDKGEDEEGELYVGSWQEVRRWNLDKAVSAW